MNDCLEEVDQATNRLFYWGAYADKYGGQVQETTLYGATVCIREPVGVVAIACPDEKPLLSFVSLIAPAIVRSNAVIVIPSEKNPIPGMIPFSTSGLEPLKKVVYLAAPYFFFENSRNFLRATFIF